MSVKQLLKAAGAIAGCAGLILVGALINPSRVIADDERGSGGADFAEFFESIRLGKDHDHLHPNCSATRTTNCFNPPFNGDLLQVMPWPAYQDWTDRDLRAVY